MTEDTEVTGPLVLNLWVSSTSEDMDIFATIRNIGPDGKDVCEVGQHGAADPMRDQRMAARVAPQARPGEVAAVPPVSRARRAPVAQARTSPSNARSRSGRRRMVFKKGHRSASTSSRATACGASVYPHYHADYNAGAREHDPRRRRQGVVPACCRSSPLVEPLQLRLPRNLLPPRHLGADVGAVGLRRAADDVVAAALRGASAPPASAASFSSRR